MRLKNKTHVIYHANIIIYYCFPDEGENRIIPYSKITNKLTELLFNQKSTIIVPHFIIREIEMKGFYDIVDDYFFEKERTLKLRLMRKINKKYETLINNRKFTVEEYEPSEVLLNTINTAYANFKNLNNIDEYLSQKHTRDLNPSLEDKKLILFSKEKGCPVISNDLDLTFFNEELLNLNLVNEIIDLKTISFIDT